MPQTESLVINPRLEIMIIMTPSIREFPSSSKSRASRSLPHLEVLRDAWVVVVLERREQVRPDEVRTRRHHRQLGVGKEADSFRSGFKF